MSFQLPFPTEYLIYGAVFLAIILLVEGVFVLFSDHRRFGSKALNRRLQVQAKSGEGAVALEQLRRPTGQLYPFPLNRLDLIARQAGSQSSPIRIVVWMCVLGTATGALLTLGNLLPLVLAIPVGTVVGIGLPLALLMRRRGKRAKRFQEQLPDALDAMARSLRAGHPFTSAMTLASGELGDPIGTELGIASDEITYGLDLREALENLRLRVNVPDLDYLIVSVVVQRQTGGNLAEILKNLSSVIRDRFRMKKKVLALSAEGRLSAWVIAIMPFFVAGALQIISPDYYSKHLDNPALWYMLGSGVVGIGIGAAIMYRVVNFRF